MIDYPYLILISILTFFSFQYWRTKWKGYFIFSVFVVFCFTAFRAPVVGADTFDYVRFFTGERNFYNDDTRSLEPLFLAYNWVLNLFTHDGVIYLLVNTIVSLAPLYYLIKRYSLNGPLSLLLFFIVSIYFTYFVGLRQILSLSFMLWAVIFVLEKRKRRWLLFIVFSVIAFYLHTSAFIVIVIYLVAFYVTIKNRTTALVIIIISAIVGIFTSSFSYINVFSLILNSNFPLMDRLSGYLGDNYYTIEENPLNIILRTTVIALFVFASIDTQRINHWFAKIYLIGVVIYNLFYPFPMISRANVAFMLMSLVVFTWIFENKRMGSILPNKYVNIISTLIMLFMLRSFVIGCINPDLTSSARMHPYYFFFEDYSNHPSITNFN